MLVGWSFDWQASSEARHGSTHDASEPRGMRLEAMEHDTDPRAQQRESAFTGHNGAEDIQERKRNKTKKVKQSKHQEQLRTARNVREQLPFTSASSPHLWRFCRRR